jgi:hypothetical protein
MLSCHGVIGHDFALLFDSSLMKCFQFADAKCIQKIVYRKAWKTVIRKENLWGSLSIVGTTKKPKGVGVSFLRNFVAALLSSY